MFGVHWTAMPTPPTSTTAASGARAATVPLTKAIMSYGLSVRSGLSGSRGFRRVQGHCLLEPVLCGSAPDVADGEREGVGGVGGLGRFGEPQQPGDHGTDLRLVGASAAGDGGLDLAGGVQGDGDAATGGAQDGDGAGLGSAHDRADVVLAEDALHRHVLGPVLVQPLLDALLDGDQAVAEFSVRGCTDHSDAEHGERPPRDALHDTDPAAGQPRVHPSTRNVRLLYIDRLFVRAIGSPPTNGGGPGTCPRPAGARRARGGATRRPSP